MPHAVGRPGAEEYAEHYAGYIARVPEENPVAAMAAEIEVTCAMLGRVSEADGLKRYAPGKWSVKEVLGHLIDAERVFAYRLFRIGRGDDTPLSGFDENEYVAKAGFDGRTLASLREEFAAVRAGTVALARGTAAEAWLRLGTANGKQISARALVYVIVGHTAHHLVVLRERYGVGG